MSVYQFNIGSANDLLPSGLVWGIVNQYSCRHMASLEGSKLMIIVSNLLAANCFQLIDIW